MFKSITEVIKHFQELSRKEDNFHYEEVSGIVYKNNYYYADIYKNVDNTYVIKYTAKEYEFRPKHYTDTSIHISDMLNKKPILSHISIGFITNQTYKSGIGHIIRIQNVYEVVGDIQDEKKYDSLNKFESYLIEEVQQHLPFLTENGDKRKMSISWNTSEYTWNSARVTLIKLKNIIYYLAIIDPTLYNEDRDLDCHVPILSSNGYLTNLKEQL